MADIPMFFEGNKIVFRYLEEVTRVAGLLLNCSQVDWGYNWILIAVW